MEPEDEAEVYFWHFVIAVVKVFGFNFKVRRLR